MRYAQVNGNLIENVIEADDTLAAERGLTLVEGLNPEPGIGWSNISGSWVAPAPDPNTANEESLKSKATTALANNVTFLGVTNPTNAQAISQVQALTRQMNALIRLQLQQFDSTSGT